MWDAHTHARVVAKEMEMANARPRKRRCAEESGHKERQAAKHNRAQPRTSNSGASICDANAPRSFILNHGQSLCHELFHKRMHLDLLLINLARPPCDQLSLICHT